MIFNKHLDRLTEVEIVQSFMRCHNMQGKVCSRGDDFSFILYRLPYVVEFYDALIENYLDIYLTDIDSGLRISGGSALGCSVDLELQNLAELRTQNYEGHPLNSIFLSEEVKKMRYLHSDLEAIDKLLPLIEAKGGLSSMRNGTFDPRFDFKDSVQPMYQGLKDKYLQCIGQLDSQA